MEKLLYTVAETSEVASIGRTTAFELIKTGELESIKIGRRRLVPRQALDDYIARLRAEQAGGAAA